MPISELIAGANPPIPAVVVVDPKKYDSCASSERPVKSSLDRTLEAQRSEGEGPEEEDERKRGIDSSSNVKRSTRLGLIDLTSVRIPTY